MQRRRLLNLDGELIGLTTALAALAGSETPGGFAVPLDAGLKRIIDVLTRGEEVEYGFLGVRFRARTRRRTGACMIDGVLAGVAGRSGRAWRAATLDHCHQRHPGA